ncbi:unnamed protein product [Discula destructiva]
MYTTTARRVYEDQIPPFMSVFDLDHDMQDSEDQDTVTVVDPKMMDMEPTCSPKLGPDPTTLLQPTAVAPSHQHRESNSTQASESADSSPTTTISCTDSSSLSDPSPSSSPDSPVNLVPLNAFPGTSFGALPSMANLTVSEQAPRLTRPMTSPAPRRRNMKGLSIQPPFAPSAASSTEPSEPSSPSFIKPKIPAMKRKPSNLSLKTNSNDLAGRPTLELPQSPMMVPKLAQRRALKHSTSSPHMLSGLKSATVGPSGGMTFPTVFERNESGLSSVFRSTQPPALGLPLYRDEPIKEEESPIRSQMANRFAFDIEPYHEKEANEDQKSPGYPDGPVAIYGDNVYLYLEPTAEEARKFDVVINVAREVHNPFNQTDETMEDRSPIPDTAATDASFATAFEYPPCDRTPTTPKAMFPAEEPEYIHMLWDHNTDISTDLMHLCETIERRTLLGKKVLVHCQQGASRSASLIIAYGLYQNPELSVNDAYYAAQSKSRWISPNMRLMYCLQDFQKQVAKRKPSPKSAFKPKSGRSPSNHRMTLSVDAIEAPKEPQTAPLPDEDSAGPEKSPLRARGFSSPDRSAVTPGPSSAPSAFSWSQQEDASDPGKFGRFNIAAIFTSPTPIDDRSADAQFAASSSSSYLIPKPPPTPGFASSFYESFARPPPSPGFAPSDPFARPPPSPGFAPTASFAKPPPSPGLGCRRFGGEKSFGFTPMNLGSFSSMGTSEPTALVERHFQPVNILPEDTALLSPRAERMTDNPIHNSFAELSAMRFVDVPPTPSTQFFSQHAETAPEKLFSPRKTEFLRDTFSSFGRPREVSDPRSPPTRGEAPIVRSIDEIL